MEQKLKTLRDIEQEQIRGFDSKLKRGTIPSRNYAWSDNLKAEAVKWVKQKREIMPFFRATDGEDFMQFFNLTEEDLK